MQSVICEFLDPLLELPVLNASTLMLHVQIMGGSHSSKQVLNEKGAKQTTCKEGEGGGGGGGARGSYHRASRQRR